MSSFKWNTRRVKAAMHLAQGFTQIEAAKESGCNEKTIRRWLSDVEFASEVDRLSLMVSIANRAERLRVTMKIVRQKLAQSPAVQTEKDLLDWLKFAQSETDGAKIDLTAVLEAMESSEGTGASAG
jgi:hypothetical protein